MAIKWTREMLQNEALKYKTRNEFRIKSSKAYKITHHRGILNEICAHMPKRNDAKNEKNHRFKWSMQKLTQEAFKYKTRKEFENCNAGAYNAARKRKVLDRVCQHMAYDRYPWSNEELAQEALLYSSKAEFEYNNSGAYQVAIKRNVLSQICKHMNNFMHPNSSNSEIELFNIIKNIYPKAQKLKERKIKIHNKPHIKGFDIDIYIPELRKGIEFDGSFYHSIAGLKRGRPTWSSEDLKHYHRIKDSYFLSKNIKILHIKEEEWLANKQECVDKCLNFLNNSI